MVDLQIGVVGIDRGGHFNHEIGEMRGIKSHESQRQAVDEPLGTHRKIREGDRTGIDLVTVVVTAGIHRLNRAFNQCPQAGIVVADLGLRDQRREAVRLLPDCCVRRQLANRRTFDKVQVITAEHLRVRTRFPVAITQIGMAPENETVPGAEDRQKIVIVPLKQILLVKGVLALAGGCLVEILTAPPPIVNDAGARLDPEARLIGAPFPDQERAPVIQRGHVDLHIFTYLPVHPGDVRQGDIDTA